MKVSLLFLSKTKFGGWVTYTAHLYRTLEAQGHEVDIVKIKDRTSPNLGDFGYGLSFHTYDLRFLHSVSKDRALLIIGIEKEYIVYGHELLKMKNTGIVFHDPRATKYVPFIPEWKNRIVSIRKNNLQYVPEATYVGHPYVRASAIDVHRTVHARSIARIDFDKNTVALLDANRILSQDKQIDIQGFENRMYSHFNIVPKYPEWKQGSRTFPANEGEAHRMMRETKFLVDMSSIKGDGGGTQYTFLEAMDAGAVCVIGQTWFNDVSNPEIVPNVHCLVCEPRGVAIAELLEKTEYEGCESLRWNADRDILSAHSPEVLGPEYTKFLERIAP